MRALFFQEVKARQPVNQPHVCSQTRCSGEGYYKNKKTIATTFYFPFLSLGVTIIFIPSCLKAIHFVW